MLECSICGKLINDRRALSNHLNRGHKIKDPLEKETIIINVLYNPDEIKDAISDYIDEKICFYELPIDIGKYLTLLGIKRNSSAERRTTRYKEKYQKAIFEKYGVTNISKSEVVKQKKIETIIEKCGSYENYINGKLIEMKNGYSEYSKDVDKIIITYNKIKETCLERYGNENFGQGVDAKAKAKLTKKATIAKWSYEERLARTEIARNSVNHRGGYSSKPEKRIRKALIDLDINAEYNKMLFKYNWDMVFDNILIEVQGTMWHAKPGLYKENDLIMGKILARDIWEKDKRKHCRARENGYIVVEIWEDDIKKASSDIVLMHLVESKINEQCDWLRNRSN